MDRIDIGERIGAALLVALLVVGVVAAVEPNVAAWVVARILP